MPAEFLTPEQRARYGDFIEEPSSEEISRYFYFDERDRALVRRYHGEPNQVGFALQICAIRYLGTFLENLVDIPAGLLSVIAGQLSLRDPITALQEYANTSERVQRFHAHQIAEFYDYRSFTGQPDHFRLVRWLFYRAWFTEERPIELFNAARQRLEAARIILPGVSVLERLVGTVRERARERLYRRIAALPSGPQTFRLELLLSASKASRSTVLDRLRRGPSRVSAPALAQALKRLKELRDLDLADIDLSAFPRGKLVSLARYANSCRAQSIARMPQERRLATLLVFGHMLTVTACDDALDIFDQLLASMHREAQREADRRRLATMKDYDKASLVLREIGVFVLDDSIEPLRLRDAILSAIPKEVLAKAVVDVGDYTKDHDRLRYEQVLSRYPTIRIFVPGLLSEVEFQGTEASKAVIDALSLLRSIEGTKATTLRNAPLAVIPAEKLHIVDRDGTVSRRDYTLCVLAELQDRLRRRDVFVPGSERWGDPRRSLLVGHEWEQTKSRLPVILSKSFNASTELQTLSSELDEAYAFVNAGLSRNPDLRFVLRDEKEAISLARLDKLPEPETLKQLKKTIARCLPLVDIAQILVEIDVRTGFSLEFSHATEDSSREAELSTTICAVLLAQACNIDFTEIARSDSPSLDMHRLRWVEQNYIRADTIQAANRRLIEAHRATKLANIWGDGAMASADGLRFRVPVETINAGPNRKYFGNKRGLTFYNLVSDQYPHLSGIVIPGTIRDSLYILELVLQNTTAISPVEITCDTHGYSDIVFALFWLLGYQFSPRLADIGDARFWRINPDTHYGLLNGIARNRVRLAVIEEHWDDILRVAASLKLGKVRPVDLMKMLQAGQKKSGLATALTELGRIPKTIHMLYVLGDPEYRRALLTQLNKQESRHTLARRTFHGHRGEIRKRYREGQEDQLSALGLVVNVITLWNTLYIEKVLEHLTEKGSKPDSEDLRRISPLVHQHIKFLGTFSFQLEEELTQGNWRPLRDEANIVALLAEAGE